MKFCYVDLETTAINPGQIGQISYIVEEHGELVKAINHFFTVKFVDAEVTRKMGIDAEYYSRMSGGQVFAQRSASILEDINNAQLIAHHVNFEFKFLTTEFMRLNMSYKPSVQTCTMEYFRDVIQIPAKNKRYGPYKNPKLSEVLDYFRIDMDKLTQYSSMLFGDNRQQLHDSRVDVVGMYVAVMLERERKSGGHSWADRFCTS